MFDAPPLDLVVQSALPNPSTCHDNAIVLRIWCNFRVVAVVARIKKGDVLKLWSDYLPD